MKLSKRLEFIIKNIKDNESVLDIGTDHAHIPIKLYKINKKRTIIATDISNFSIQKAKKNAINNSVNIDLRLGNGLEVINDNEKIDVMVISGLGGNKIIEILNSNKDKLSNFKKFIFLTNKDDFKLREFLYRNNFIIKNDSYIFENNFYYTLIKCYRKNKINKFNFLNKFLFRKYVLLYYGFNKENQKNEHIKYKINKLKNINKNLPMNKKYFFKKLKNMYLIRSGEKLLNEKPFISR